MVKQAEKAPGIRAYFPIMGLIIAIAVGVLAYFLAPMLIKFIAEQEFQGTTQGEFYYKLDIRGYNNTAELDAAIQNSKVHLAFSALLWLITFSVMMLIVSIAIGEDPDREYTILHPRPGDIKGAKKFVADQEKLQKRRAEQAKDLQRRQKNK